MPFSTINGTFNNKPFLVGTGLYQFWLGLMLGLGVGLGVRVRVRVRVRG